MILAGMPVAVSPDRPDLFNPIHEDDIIRMLPGLVGAATVPATIVNLGGDETVALEEWCEFLGALVDRPVSFDETTATISSVSTDNSKRRALVGDTRVAWRDGFEQMARARHPELFDAVAG
jgi:hypothetical protein